ncbi:MAG: glycosyltransferase family 39 protein [Armatimonadetes bacterium]|nr:glycosyltransferase family 39 protein [Armatimonadota bacterium]
MVGVLITVLFALLAGLAGMALFGRWMGGLDPAERLGLGGLLGLASVGLLTLFVGLMPDGLSFGLYVVSGLVVVGAAFSVAKGRLRDWKFSSQGPHDLLGGAALGIVGLLALVAVLAPSLAADWDSIAYHLAVPKLWLEAGQIHYVQGIHQSNFPAAIDNLFIWGLKWGGQSGAKAFSLMVYGFGCLSMFGLARRWYGRGAGWWAAIGFAGIPVVAWESGTAYIDVAHGLFAGLGLLYAVEAFVKQDADRRNGLVLAGLCLGFAMGTKYTGIQMLVAVAVVLGITGLITKQVGQGIKAKLVVGVIAVLIACPWYIKTASFTGNPVFPFFSSVLGGKDWNPWRAEIYTVEQQGFGVGKDPLGIGGAILGLGYQPGRYTNPRQDEGGGLPVGALGFAALLGGVAACVCGRLRREEKMVLAAVGLGFLMWFFLSQQSRYLTMLAIPLAVLGAGMVGRVRWGPLVAAGVCVQIAATAYMIDWFQTKDQLRVVSGKVDEDLYLSERLPFYLGAEAINRLDEGSRVALYDEVFGFYIDGTDYFWANPGHSMLIPYETIDNGEQLVAELRKLGFTHLYLNVKGQHRIMSAMNYGEVREPYTEEERAEMSKDLNRKWRYLVADAKLTGSMSAIEIFEDSLLFTLSH